MHDQYEQFKKEVTELLFFTLKLLFHWLALVTVLFFVLITVWIHQFFRQSYSTLDGSSAHAKEAGVLSAPAPANRSSVVKNNHVRRQRTRRTRSRRLSQTPIEDVQIPTAP